MPLYSRLPAADREELHRLTVAFLAHKDFEGCGGLEITDEVRLTIAAHACLLLLHRRGDVFPSVTTVLVYPSAFVVDERPRRGEDGVVSAGPRTLAGEAWQHGPVILAWDDVLAGAEDERDGHNVVLHEFAHKLDAEDGAVDGTPDLGPSARYAEWARMLSAEYRRLRRDAAEGRRTCWTATAPRTRRSSSPWPPRPSSRSRSCSGSAIPSYTRNLRTSTVRTRPGSSKAMGIPRSGIRDERRTPLAMSALCRRRFDGVHCLRRSAA